MLKAEKEVTTQRNKMLEEKKKNHSLLRFEPQTDKYIFCLYWLVWLIHTHASLPNWNNILLIQSFIMMKMKTMYKHSEPFLNGKKVLSSNIWGTCFFLSFFLLMHSNVFQALHSLGSSTLPLGSQRGLFSIMAYGKVGRSQLVKSSFLGTLQLLKSNFLALSQPNSSFLSRARLLMLPGGLPGLTLYPAALVVPRGLPGLVLNPAALVVPSGRPVLVR